MNVTIIGAGRIGSALARRSVALKHSTRMLVRSLKSPTIRPLPADTLVEPIGTARATESDLVILAAPAWADQRKEALIRDFIARSDASSVICSTTAYKGAPTSDWAPKHPFLWFMCSPAIAEPSYKAQVISCINRRGARSKFEQWIGPADIHHVSEREFHRMSSLFLIAAAHCETLRKIDQRFKTRSSRQEKSFATATLLEAHAIMQLTEFDAANALDWCLTPRGATKELLRRFWDKGKSGRHRKRRE